MPNANRTDEGAGGGLRDPRGDFTDRLVAASPMGIHRYRLEQDGRLVFVGANPAADRLLGIDNSQFVGMTIEEAFPPLADTQIPGHYRAAARDGARWSDEQVAYEDEQIRGAFQVYAFQTAPGEMAALFLDVTARKRAEADLRASEAHLRSLIRAAPVGIGVTRNRVLRQVNDHLCTLLGYSAGELLDQSARLLYPTEAEFEAVGRDKYAQIATHGTGTVETRMQRKDGIILDVLLSSTPLDPENLSAGVTFTVLDLTERKRAGRRLSRLTESLAALGADHQENVVGLTRLAGELLDARTAFYWCRAEGGVTHVAHWHPPEALAPHYPTGDLLGSEALFGTTPAVVWRDDLQTDPDASRDPFVTAFVLESGLYCPVRRQREVVGVLAVGHEHRAEASRDDQQLIATIARAIGTEEERRRAAEERRQFEAQLQHAQKLESLGVLAGGIAHDFNNLLAGILGNTSVALLDLPPESSVRECVQDVERSARRAADLVRQMLAYAGKGRFVVDLLNVETVITEIAHLLEASISKKATLRFNFAADLPAVRADATQMRQVLMNLITNASDALGDEPGVISLSTGIVQCDAAYLAETYLDDELPEGRYVYVEVADTGAGMDEETLARIFDPFFSTKFTGRGLGLAAVLGIVRGHHGALKVYSEVGRGSTFKMLLPAAARRTERLRPAPAGLDGWRASGTVLLVDDEEIVRATGARMLRRLGFEVLLACDGIEALEVFAEHQAEIVCVVLDLTMPHLDGEQCFRELRRLRRDVRVILSSGYNEQDLIDRFAGKGLAGFVQKPYSAQSLGSKLREVLRD